MLTVFCAVEDIPRHCCVSDARANQKLTVKPLFPHQGLSVWMFVKQKAIYGAALPTLARVTFFSFSKLLSIFILISVLLSWSLKRYITFVMANNSFLWVSELR